MTTTSPQNTIIGYSRAKPFSGAKALDITRVAQRMLDETGHSNVKEVFQKCRARIPGEFERYRMTLVQACRKNQLKPRQRQ